MSNNNGNGKKSMDNKLVVSSRFASDMMQRNFSNQKKYLIWRQLWTNIAKYGKKVGLKVTDKEIRAMEENTEVDKAAVSTQDNLMLHDEIIAQANIFFKQCCLQGSITKLALLSDFILDNMILILARDGFNILLHHIATIIKNFASMALQYKSLPTFSPSTSLTTTGEVIAQWINELLIDQKVMQNAQNDLKFRGLKASEINAGIIGDLFDYDIGKINSLNKYLANSLDFKDMYPNIGESYARNVDFQVLSSVYTLGGTIYKILTTLQALINQNEINNPFEDIDASNSMSLQRCLCLTRHLMTLNSLPVYIRSLNWLQRKSEDELNRKTSLFETFVTADAILFTLADISKRITFRQKEIMQHFEQKLPLKCANSLIIAMVRKGENKRRSHEIVNNFIEKYRQEIKYNFDISVIDKIKTENPNLQPIFVDLKHLLNFEASVTRISAGVEEFLKDNVEIILKQCITE